MIITRENERLYLATWEYNASRILTELAKIVINSGGKVKPLKKAIITYRHIDSEKRKYKEKIEHLTELEKTNHNNTRAAAIINYREALEALEKVNNDPITVTHTSYINFVYDGFYYYYQVDDNPFFEFFYIKTLVKNGRYSRDTYLTEDKKEWLFDCFFTYNCSSSDVVEAANHIFNMLIQAKPSEIHKETKREKVANIYDGGYHYETIRTPERFTTIDF